MPFHALAKQLDQEERRHKGQFPVDEPVEKVEGGEGAKQAGELEAEQGEVGAWSVGMAPGGEDDERSEQGGEEQDEGAGAVEADEVLDAQCGDPVGALLKLKAALWIETQQHHCGEHQ